MVKNLYQKNVFTKESNLLELKHSIGGLLNPKPEQDVDIAIVQQIERPFHSPKAAIVIERYLRPDRPDALAPKGSDPSERQMAHLS